MVFLTLMRHGESLANANNVFTGWNDVPLTTAGIGQAHAAGQKIRATGIRFSDVHTSFLIRAIDTANIVLDEIEQAYIMEHKSWRLNERHYGALRGQNKQAVKQRVGVERFNQWRRSFNTVPPLLSAHDHDERYTSIGVTEPLGESLRMAYDRIMPYWVDSIAPRLLDHHNQLVVAHGSTIRALIKYLERIDDDVIDQVEVPNGAPIQYQLDAQLRIVDKITL
ncbi:2,3-bisphosphoglycerate-dependent phosphoglycerate mutase [Nicoliella spurrieriana]|uniref:2,3-bisphosphoglycerate-dependent phosphoglycerate mutase n=1 Tax=Nicoliella spurrieriana TaxID=2925830 RepID=A0A976X5K5_9LACO|nr:2,3-bisphosphoglycerate-dependent phosphoglycerate mutase [Nicoliella spurrieriana]UQS87028.1 2,3-bisphosphoglycerate-dependent phosphoglycerate mutase [Nicoliella spurrieriana]